MILGFALFTIVLVVPAKKLSAQNASTRKVILLLTFVIFIPVLVFIGLFLLDTRIVSPLSEFHEVSIYLVGALALCFFIGLSIWSKSWIMLVVVVTLSVLLQKILHYSDVVSLHVYKSIYSNA